MRIWMLSQLWQTFLAERMQRSLTMRQLLLELLGTSTDVLTFKIYARARDFRGIRAFVRSP
jgi:hypothetical protein